MGLAAPRTYWFHFQKARPNPWPHTSVVLSTCSRKSCKACQLSRSQAAMGGPKRPDWRSSPASKTAGKPSSSRFLASLASLNLLSKARRREKKSESNAWPGPSGYVASPERLGRLRAPPPRHLESEEAQHLTETHCQVPRLQVLLPAHALVLRRPPSPILSGERPLTSTN